MIRAVAFDAVGTLIHPEPAAWTVYAEVGRRFGSQLSESEIRTRFRAAFAAEEARDGAGALRTSEERERQRWQTIVAAVLDDVSEPAACFEALHRHFALPAAWRCTPGTEALLAELRRRGLHLALASNYDARLRSVWAGLPELRTIDTLVISSEVGWRKPAPGFFAALGTSLGLPAAEIAFVGDDPVNDHDGARRAGLVSVPFRGDLGEIAAQLLTA